jgi:hypothetical protein
VGDLLRVAAPVGVLDVEFLVAVAGEDDLAPSRREDGIAVVRGTGDEGNVVRAVGVDLVDVGGGVEPPASAA